MPLGSIVDVTTLKNCIKYLEVFNLKDISFILDRDFFSKANMLRMDDSTNNIAFIQPLPYSLKKVKALIRENKKDLIHPKKAFKFNEEILCHLQREIEFDGNVFDRHI